MYLISGIFLEVISFSIYVLFCCMSQKNKDLAPHYDPFFKAVGRRLKEVRIKAGYTNYEKFAIEHDIGRSQYLRYENGENLNLKTLAKILIALKMEPEDFFKGVKLL